MSAEGYLGEKLNVDDYVVDVRDKDGKIYRIINLLPHVIGVRGKSLIHYRPARWFRKVRND